MRTNGTTLDISVDTTPIQNSVCMIHNIAEQLCYRGLSGIVRISPVCNSNAPAPRSAAGE
jgi:hypothetical protein